ncbi:MAG TPA: MFS transporter [Rhizomicrobium sp.]|nr:MFS transporter [Rhizomicrobium sp.]
MAESIVTPAVSPPVRIRHRHVAAAVIGNAVEFYDFSTYAYFATQIGNTFFPSKSAFASLMASLIVFGVGFVGRPIGAFVIGLYGDRAGRRPAMLFSFTLMGVALLGLALTPSYAAIGAAAPVIVVALRLLQGFALGGDVGPTTAFLLEASPPAHRGFYASLQYASQGLSALLAGLAGFVLSRLLDAPQLESYGWRIAFLLGAIILPIGFIIRRTLPETLHRPEDEAAAEASTDDWRRTAAVGFAALASATIAYYTLSYMTTFASRTLFMRIDVSFAATVAFGLSNVIFAPLGGFLSDRIGRRPVMVGSRVLFALVGIPAFMLLIRNRDTTTLLVATFVLGALSQLASPQIAALTEALPKGMRSASLSIIYALAIATFGGTTQPVITWLLHATGNLLMPAYYLTVGNIAGIVSMWAMRETAPAILARGQSRR